LHIAVHGFGRDVLRRADHVDRPTDAREVELPVYAYYVDVRPGRGHPHGERSRDVHLEVCRSGGFNGPHMRVAGRRQAAGPALGAPAANAARDSAIAASMTARFRSTSATVSGRSPPRCAARMSESSFVARSKSAWTAPQPCPAGR